MAQDHSVQDEQAQMDRATAYREWLGIENPIPTYYEALGLPGLESDADAIFEAGREAKRKLRSYQVGRYKAQALELLTDVGQAVSILTNPEKKRAYDSDLVRAWLRSGRELHDKHCMPRTGADALVAWMAACRGRGMPVVRLMPGLIRGARTGRASWPADGVHGLDLLTALWVYRDAVIIGQCVETMALEKRVQLVKRAQQTLGIPEALARVVAEELSRSRHLFEPLRLVRQARHQPDAVLLRLARRMRRFGGRVGHRSKVLVAVARLLGRHRQDLQKILADLDEPAAELSPATRASRVARKAREQARGKALDVRYWVEEHPQLLVVAAVLLGAVMLVLAVLVLTGAWSPWAEPVGRLEPPRFQETVVPPVKPGPKVETPAPTPPEPVLPEPAQPALPEDLLEFIRKYPAGDPPPPEPPHDAPADPPPETAQPPDGREPVKPKPPPKGFFGIPHDLPAKGSPKAGADPSPDP